MAPLALGPSFGVGRMCRRLLRAAPSARQVPAKRKADSLLAPTLPSYTPRHRSQAADFDMPAKCIFTPAEDELLAAGIQK